MDPPLLIIIADSGKKTFIIDLAYLFFKRKYFNKFYIFPHKAEVFMANIENVIHTNRCENIRLPPTYFYFFHCSNF